MKDTVREVLDRNIQNMFVELAEKYDLPTGDFAPEQEFKLNEIKEELGDLLGDYVHQNLGEDE